ANRNFRNEQRMERKQDKFTLLTKTVREILALDKRKFKPPPSMTTPIEKRNASKFCRKALTFDQGIKAKPRKRPCKDSKKGKTSGKDKPLAILMMQPWQRILRQRITQTFSSESVISFPTLREEDGTEGPMIIEAEIGGHCVHRIYVNGGSSSEILSPSPYNGIIGRSGGKKDPSNPIHGARNDKIPSCWQNSHIAEQQDYPIRMLNGFGTRSTAEGRKELCGLLRRHLDEFVWKPTNMTGVPQHIGEHRLNVREVCLPIRQKKRGQAPERNKAINEEVKKLVEADIMKEVHYHTWLSNPVIVKKHDDSWRMCVDFKDLNKACPKDGYPLPKIYWKRLVDKAFQKQISRNLEVYVDDLVIKSRTEKEMIRDIEETFKTLREINIKLNPKKCAFGMRECTFLGYKVDADGLRVCPDKMEYASTLHQHTKFSSPDIGLVVLVFQKDYESLIAGLRIAGKIGVNRIYIAKESSMIREKAIDEKEILAVIEEEGHTWMTQVYEYLVEGILPEEKKRKQGLNLIRECKDCQVHRPVPRNPQEKLTPITSPWPFYKWGIDIAGPFLEGPGKGEYNNMIPSACSPVLPRLSNGDTPFSLTYGTEAVILAEIGMPIMRTSEVDLVQNNEALEIKFDLLEEKREQTAIRKAKTKAKIEKYYNSKVPNISFKLEDLMYCNNDASHAKDTWKLGTKWEGPYEVTEVLGKGVYKLRDRDGKQLPRTWNVSNLKKCYIHKI
nr:retrovirus-related Pol polyprotein from transposon opus [Tanacetum cinerariifolium]